MTRRAATPTGERHDLADTTEGTPSEPAERERSEPRGKPGPAHDPDSLTAQRKDGRGSHLHAVIPAELHRRMKVRSVMTGEPVAAMVAEACAEYLRSRSE